MKHQIASSLALAASLAVLGSLTALAAQAETPDAAAPLSTVYKIAVEGSASGQEPSLTVAGEGAPVPMKQFDLKTDRDGNRYFVTEDGETVYLTVCESPGQAADGGTIEFTPAR